MTIRVFRTLYLEQNSIAILPPLGFQHRDKQSKRALRWLEYLAHTTGKIIKYSANGEEKK